MKNTLSLIMDLNRKAKEQITKIIEESESGYLEKKKAAEILQEKFKLKENVYKESKKEILEDLGVSEEEFFSMLVDQAIEENDNLFDLMTLEDEEIDDTEFDSGFPTKFVTGVYKLVLYESGEYHIIPKEMDYMFDKFDFDYEIFSE